MAINTSTHLCTSTFGGMGNMQEHNSRGTRAPVLMQRTRSYNRIRGQYSVRLLRLRMSNETGDGEHKNREPHISRNSTNARAQQEHMLYTMCNATHLSTHTRAHRHTGSLPCGGGSLPTHMYHQCVCVYVGESGCYNSRKNCVVAATCPQYIVVVARAVLTVLLTGKNPVRELKYYSVVSHLHILGTIISVLNDQNHRRVCTAFSPGDICRTVVGEVCLFHSVPGCCVTVT